MDGPPARGDEAAVCPKCGSKAFNRYGRVANGKQRYICLVCGRQFVVPSTRRPLTVERPCCPNCGRSMHIYQRTKTYVRFRCSTYPECNTYLRVPLEDDT
jgi:DNA-directed RNA polymerase subunit RPC12/RpoP